ncbi:hypothetical protein FB561_0530 [Kribbella amoyensis]|uniref:Uncharacterized protein n=1 Tax=Kribbella amoyensis TaxID=996641 RepID=A0A561BKS5_9ACTN|nr:hypothetical protein [Kribbella amoyensis]TWD79471.1 hypothetical protein FB561_0530 [Kribbella amoyensis]
MPEPEYEPEQEFGPRIADAFQTKADAARGLRSRGLATEARRRVRKRRQALVAGSAAVVVAVAIGGVWGAIGGPSPVSTSASDNSAGSGQNKEAAPRPDLVCPDRHPILTANGDPAPRTGNGLDLETPVYGLQACRYRLTPGATMLLGSASFNATKAQELVDAIKVLPERNPALPVFKCVPEKARPAEAIVLRFATGAGQREVWVQYDGCAGAGFFTGTRTYGLYAAPLKLLLQGTLRPTGGTYLTHLKGW